MPKATGQLRYSRHRHLRHFGTPGTFGTFGTCGTCGTRGTCVTRDNARVPYLAGFIYAAGSIVCHQLPERSFHMAGVQLPVCARCTGLYVGGLVGIIVWLARVRRPVPHASARRALMVAAIPTIVTVVTAAAGWWDPDNAVRAALAMPLGLSVGAIVTAVALRDLR